MSDLFLAEPIIFFGRHFVVRILPSNHGNQKGLIWFARNKEVVDEFSTFEKALAARKVEISFDFFGILSMASSAFGGDDGQCLCCCMFVRAESEQQSRKEKNQDKELHACVTDTILLSFF
jgi:hypothetical protein